MNRSATECTRILCALLSAAAIATLPACKSKSVKVTTNDPAPTEFENTDDANIVMEGDEITDAEAVAAIGEPVAADTDPTQHMAPDPDGTMMPVLDGFTTPDGLGIEDLRVGEGDEAKHDSVIVIRYHGTLVDGTVVDTTRGQSAVTYPLFKLIQGWRQGIPGMKVGGIRRLTVPPALAYGSKGVAAAGIPSNATLTYSIELVDVQASGQANVGN